MEMDKSFEEYMLERQTFLERFYLRFSGGPLVIREGLSHDSPAVWSKKTKLRVLDAGYIYKIAPNSQLLQTEIKSLYYQSFRYDFIQ